MKNKHFIAMLLLVALVFTVFNVEIGAESASPSAAIVANNLSFNDTIYLVYYVDFKDVPSRAETGVLIWKSVPNEYTYDTADEVITTVFGNSEFNGATYPLYAYCGLNAKNMTDDIYAVPYIKSEKDITYGNLVKYSVLRYAYNKLGYSGTATSDENLKNLLVQMLDYGAAAQTYFNYKKDALATSEFYLVKVTNGLLTDRTRSGLYRPGTTVTMNAYMPEGQTFDHWEDQDGNVVGNTETIQVTVGDKNMTYTAVSKSETPPASQFTVTFKDWDGKVLKEETVDEGKSATPPADPTRDAYSFAGWDGNYSNVSKNEVVTATYKLTGVVFSFAGDTAKIGDTLVLTLSIESAEGVYADGVIAYNLQYDSSVATFEGFTGYGDLVTNSVAGNNSIANNIINLGYSPAIVANGKICELQFKIKDTAADGAKFTVSMQASVSKDRMPVNCTVVAPSTQVTLSK